MDDLCEKKSYCLITSRRKGFFRLKQKTISNLKVIIA